MREQSPLLPEKTMATELSERTSVPLKWLLGVCSVLITGALLYASTLVSDIKNEITQMRLSMNDLNVSVAVLLKDREYTARDMDDIKKRVAGLEQRRR